MAVYRRRLCSNLSEGVNVRSDFQLEDLRAQRLEVFDSFKGLCTSGRNNFVAAFEGGNC